MMETLYQQVFIIKDPEKTQDPAVHIHILFSLQVESTYTVAINIHVDSS